MKKGYAKYSSVNLNINTCLRDDNEILLRIIKKL